MKRARKKLFVVVAFVLFFITLFSFAFIHAQFETHCQHQTACERCEELAFDERVLSDTVETHGACQSPNCETCDLIELQRIALEKAKAEKHVCSETLCADCLKLQAQRKTLKIVLLRVAIALLAIVPTFETLVYICRKVKNQNGFSLISLKVKLTD